MFVFCDHGVVGCVSSDYANLKKRHSLYLPIKIFRHSYYKNRQLGTHFNFRGICSYLTSRLKFGRLSIPFSSVFPFIPFAILVDAHNFNRSHISPGLAPLKTH